MNIACFVGLTIQPNEARQYLNAIYFGPVSGGDIPTLIAEYEIDAIGIIDGVFHSRQAVLHKDIMHALSRGVAVFGAASMGALRAVELDSFGMVGVGEIYRQFRSGELTGDDEVAVPCYFRAEHGWRVVPGAEALVNMRATIGEAIRRGIIEGELGSLIIRQAKSVCYSQRSWDEVLLAVQSVTTAEALARFKSALPEVAIDVKRQDAIELLQTMSNWVDTSRKRIARTQEPSGPFWDAALFARPICVRPLDARHDFNSEGAPLVQNVLDFAAICDIDSAQIVQDAMIRTVLLELAPIVGALPTSDQVSTATRNLETRLENTHSAPPFDKGEIARLAADEAICEVLHTRYSTLLDRGLLLTLLVEGRFKRIAGIVEQALTQARLPLPLPSGEAARLIVEQYLSNLGIINPKDHFDRYLSWMPEHRLRVTAAIVQGVEDARKESPDTDKRTDV